MKTNERAVWIERGEMITFSFGFSAMAVCKIKKRKNIYN
jgi:hypothetical protein